MSTIDLVDPELREALAQWILPPLTTASLARRRASEPAIRSLPHPACEEGLG